MKKYHYLCSGEARKDSGPRAEAVIQTDWHKKTPLKKSGVSFVWVIIYYLTPIIHHLLRNKKRE